MSQNIIVQVRIERDEPCEPPEGQEDMTDFPELTLETDCTPEEAGYGHGV